MAELGCDTALNLDGGGSTMVGVQYPGYDKCATANSPTDGSMRACANFIFFVREKTEAEAADRLFLYPAHSFALPGATVGFSLKATDANYVATSLPSRLSWSSNYGTLGSNSLTLDAAAGGSISEATVTVKSDGMSGRASITVLKEVTGITVTKEDGKTKAQNAPCAGRIRRSAGRGRDVLRKSCHFCREQLYLGHNRRRRHHYAGRQIHRRVSLQTHRGYDQSLLRPDQRFRSRDRQPCEPLLRYEGPLGRGLYQRSLF